MLNLDFICAHPDVIRDTLRKRRDTRNIDDILHLSEQRRGVVTRKDGLYAALKKLRETIRATPVEKRTLLNAQSKAITTDIRLLELQCAEIDARLQRLMLSLPNIPHATVREGDGALVGDEVRRWGQGPAVHFQPLPHWDLGERLGIIEIESAAKLAGSHFVTLRGAGARLERALISFMLDVHTRSHGYIEVMPPQLVRRSIMVGTGQLPKFEGEVYACSEDELYLNPTAEVPLIGMHTDTMLAAEQLPLRYTAWTTAFRREAISPSLLHRGLLRLHQFNKVELVQVVEPEASYTVLDEMTQHAENILQQLELPYRIVELNAANLPFASAKTYDIEVWMPGLDAFVEVSSISNCETFQSQRANIRYRLPNNTRTLYPHTLNASGLAVGRTMAAILEVYQQADCSVVIPKVLRPYMGLSLLLPLT